MTIMKAIGSVFNLYPASDYRAHLKNRSDSSALKSDWQVVGDAIRKKAANAAHDDQPRSRAIDKG